MENFFKIIFTKSLKIYLRWPGSNHDQSIFNFSLLKIRLEDGEFGDSLLLGDAGYSCKRYLLTPLASPVTTAEKNYQKAFVQTRLIVERTIGIWKRRFPVIATSKLTTFWQSKCSFFNVRFSYNNSFTVLEMRCDLNTSVVVIVATSVLHNWLRGRPVPPVDEQLPPPYLELDVVNATDSSDFARRNEIINNFFQ